MGQKLTDQLIPHQNIYELIASSKGVNRHPVKEGYEYIQLDITDSTQLTEAVQQHRPDFIINTAAMTNVDACENDQMGCTRLNIDAVSTLVSLCETYGCHLIHLSTDFVFDGQNGPYSEEDEVNPLSYYGKSKVEAEKIIQQSTCQWSILRTILVYGVVADMSRSNIVLWAKSTLEKGGTISAVTDQWRMPTLAEDLAASCIAVIEKKATGIFHISGKDFFSIYELIEEIADFWKLDKNLIRATDSSSLGQAAPRPARTGFILDKAYTQLDYNPKSFREGLALVDKQIL